MFRKENNEKVGNRRLNIKPTNLGWGGRWGGKFRLPSRLLTPRTSNRKIKRSSLIRIQVAGVGPRFDVRFV